MVTMTTTYHLPKLLHHLPVVCHPEHVQIEREYNAWLWKHVHLIESEAAFPSLKSQRLALWVCLCNPHGSTDRLIEVAKFTQAATLCDDYLTLQQGEQLGADAVEAGPDAQSWGTRVAQLKGILAGKCPEDLRVRALFDTWQQIDRQLTPSQKLRHRSNLDFTLESLGAEREMRTRHQELDLDTYLQIRKGTLYWTIYSFYTEYVLEIELPLEAFNDPRWLALHQAHTEHAILTNDLLSYPKELHDGDVDVNAITVLMRKKGILLQQAVDELADRIKQAEERFIAIRDELLADRRGIWPEVHAYLLEVGYLLSASTYFQLRAPRYHWKDIIWDEMPSDLQPLTSIDKTLPGLVTIFADEVRLTPLSEEAVTMDQEVSPERKNE